MDDEVGSSLLDHRCRCLPASLPASGPPPTLWPITWAASHQEEAPLLSRPPESAQVLPLALHSHVLLSFHPGPPSPRALVWASLPAPL